MKEQLARLRKLPVRQKQHIVWGAVVLIGLVLAVWWMNSAVRRFREVDWSGGPERPTLSGDEAREALDRYWSGWDLEEVFSGLEELEESIQLNNEQERAED